MLAGRSSLMALRVCPFALLALIPTGLLRAQPQAQSYPPGGQLALPSAAPGAPRELPLEGAADFGRRIVAVRIVGNETVSEDQVVSQIRTRPDREFDAATLQADKRRLISSLRLRDVRIYTQRVAGGIEVTFEVFERPTVGHLRFLGNRGVSDRALGRESGLEVGESLDPYAVQEARRKIEELYHRRGYPHAVVEIVEGNDPNDGGVALRISEGPLQRITSVNFVGNTIVSDERLKTQIQSKPGYLWYFLRGKVDQQKIDEDEERLTAYYRSLGFFRARVSCDPDYDDRLHWVKLTFVIDEGPRYVVSSVQVVGNSRFSTGDLNSLLELKPGDYFNLDTMLRDRNELQDLYGSHGHIYVDIQADPRFRFEEPGTLDMIFKIEEGDQFRVGRINVHIAGEYPHTRESVVRNRLSIKPGDIVDMREVRNSERRLGFSQLFENDPASGKVPRIEIRQPQLSDADQFVAGQRGDSVRGQSPEDRGSPADEVTLDVYLPPFGEAGTPMP